MPLVTSTEMFKKAYEGGYAIGAFNVNNMEIIQGITEAAKIKIHIKTSSICRSKKDANQTYLIKLIELQKKKQGFLTVSPG
jgi:fructose-bisphosphate aldolase class II